MQNKIRIIYILWTIVASIFFTVNFLYETHLKQFSVYVIITLFIGSVYEIWQRLRTQKKIYWLAFLIGLGWMFFLGLANGAVGIIGSENNPANLMYWAVFAVRIIGSLISRLRSRGMRITLFITAFVQLAIPVFAFFIWPAQASWGNAGVIGVFFINLIFALLFISSALLFGRDVKLKR